MKKIAITGPNGLIGARLQELLKDRVQLIPFDHTTCDITNKKNVVSCLNNNDFDLLLHMAAYTNVDGAEREKDQAYQINVQGTKNVFDVVSSLGKEMIYISTDFVFSGKDGPYDETSIPDPIGYYGETKYQGEQILKDKAMIVRISYPYGTSPAPKKGFVRTLASLLSQGKQLHMVTDSQFTPTYIDDIASALEYLMHHYQPEIYHIAGSESLSPYEAGMIIAQEYGYDTNLIQKTTYEAYFKGKAPRPQYSIFQSIKNTFYPMRSFREGVKDIINLS